MTNKVRLIHSIALTFFFLVSGSAADPGPYSAIDRHALAAPRSAEASIESLARYLAKSCRNDSEKARAIYRWVAANIRYDTKAYFSGRVRSSGAAGALKNRTAVCEGFSSLFEALGKAAGLEVVTVSGWARGYGSAAGEPIRGGPDHAWNAVRINGRWKLVDPTWGGGVLDEAGKYVRRFDEYFFFTPPEKLIATHFPEDAAWQLLDPAVTRAQFDNRPFIRPAFFRFGLETASHGNCRIEAADTVLVTLAARVGTVVLARLLASGTESSLDPGYTFSQRQGENLLVRAAFPKSGDYILRIFAKNASDSGPAEWAVDYRIRAQRRSAQRFVFPETYQGFMEHGAFLAAPLSGRLRSGTGIPFRLAVPGAEEVMVDMGKSFRLLERKGEWFEGAVRALPGEITVYAKFPGE
ncbi:hypothetical protein JW777_02840, partial [bacterium]|nr:hypothetical protein [bacterium]